MFKHIFSFELWYRLKKVSTYIYFVLFFLAGFFGVYRASVGGGLLRKLLSAGVGNVNADAPYVLYYLITVASHFGILITAAFFTNAAFRDFKENFHELYFSYPVRKIDYFAGRFFGALAASLFVFSAVGFGAFLGRIFPFTNADKVGPVDLWAYIQPYLVGVLPNILFAGALFFSLVLLTRKFFSVYVGVTGLLVFYLVGESLARTRSDFLAALIDPFGKLATQGFYEYWAAAQKNILLIPLSGDFLLNRILWSALAVALLIFTYRKFRLSYMLEPGRIHSPLSGCRANNQKSPPRRRRQVNDIVTVERLFGFKNHIRQVFSASLHEFRVLVKNTYFLVILFLGTAFIFILGFRNVGLVRGTQTLPVTSQVLAATQVTLYLFSLLLILFCSGELVWRERSKKVDQIYDVLPVPTWVPFSGKLGALMLVQALLVTIIMVAGIITQVLHGFTHFELGLYIKELFGIRLVYYCLISVLAMFIQVLVNKKFLGFVITFLLVDDLLPTLGFNHHLWRFASVPDYVYSDMNGYGPFAQGIFFFNLYWIAFAVILILLAVLFRVRGKDTGLKIRIRKAKERLTGRKLLVGAAALLACIIFGGYIIYNTNILNRFESRKTTDLIKVEYEKKYKKYETMPQPQVTDIKLNVDIYPYRRRVFSRGRIVLKNKTDTDVTRLFIQGSQEGKINRLRLKLPWTLVESAGNHAVYIYRLDKPMQPGEETLLDFEIELEQKGFKNHYTNSTWRSLYTRLVPNGTFLYAFDVIPAFGYDPYFANELADNDKRKKYGLQPKEIIASINDTKVRKQSPIGKDAYRVNYEAVVSTSKDQTALTSGELINEWKEGDRRYFHYRTRDKILKYFSFLSAKYYVKKDKWQDIDIEIYYHKGHDTNIDLMIKGVKKSLEYYSENFSPYQFKQVKIAEFPKDRLLYAEGFPNLIPFSEGYGFIAKFDGSKVEYVFRVTAHEVSHQWWGHQVMGGYVEGMFLLSEGLAQYSALMVSKKEYPRAFINEYIKTRIDHYLRGRARETRKEVPLALTNFGARYINYEKSMVVMNALQDYIGEDNLNAAIGKFLQDAAFREPPFPTSMEFLEYVKAATPPHLKYILTDMFETITLYENKAVNATYEQLAGRKYRVILEFAAEKIRADGAGNEKSIEIKDYITFGVFGDKGEELYLQ
ncbi:MAG: hypothetical protein KAT34_12995, partial [Candidatus Aminicenantes bacterium]|nr:hypothetical protein [Candidatus Aminicenantes bacterium]